MPNTETRTMREQADEHDENVPIRHVQTVHPTGEDLLAIDELGEPRARRIMADVTNRGSE